MRPGYFVFAVVSLGVFLLGITTALAESIQFAAPGSGGDDFYTHVGRTSNFIRFGQKFTTTQSATEISGTFLIQRGGTTENLVLQVQTNNAGIPGDVVLASSTWAYTSVTNANCGTDTTISLASTTVALDADTTYWLVFAKAGLTETYEYVYRACQDDGGTADAKCLLNGSWGICNNDYYNIVGSILTNGTETEPPATTTTSTVDVAEVVNQLNIVNLSLALLLGIVAAISGYAILKYGD